jgi:hypothetical protein
MYNSRFTNKQLPSIPRAAHLIAVIGVRNHRFFPFAQQPQSRMLAAIAHACSSRASCKRRCPLLKQ